MAKDSSAGSRIVADGPKRIIAEELPRIQSAVRARYAEEWARAGFLKKIRLRLRMQREIRAELDRLAPRTGLYAVGAKR